MAGGREEKEVGREVYIEEKPCSRQYLVSSMYCHEPPTMRECCTSLSVVFTRVTVLTQAYTGSTA